MTRCTIVGVLVAMSLLIQSGEAAGQADRVPRLFDVTTARGVFDAGPVAPTAVFAPDETPIYVWFRCDGCTVGTTIFSSWWYLEQEPPVRFAHGSMTANTLEDFGEFHCELASGRVWPAGRYEIELRVDDEPALRVAFQVVVDTQQDRGGATASSRTVRAAARAQ